MPMLRNACQQGGLLLVLALLWIDLRFDPTRNRKGSPVNTSLFVRKRTIRFIPILVEYGTVTF